MLDRKSSLVRLLETGKVAITRLWLLTGSSPLRGARRNTLQTERQSLSSLREQHDNSTKPTAEESSLNLEPLQAYLQVPSRRRSADDSVDPRTNLLSLLQTYHGIPEGSSSCQQECKTLLQVVLYKLSLLVAF